MRSLPVFSLGLDSSGPFQATWSFFFHLRLCLFVACWYIQERAFYWMSSAQTAVESGGLLRDLVAASVCVCVRGWCGGGTGGMATTKERPVNGYCSICIWFPAGRRAEIRAESENTWRGSAGSEDHHTHCAERGGERGNGNLWEELDWINRVLRSPAPYYPMIYTAWELGNASRWRRPSVFHRKKSGIPRLTPIKSPGIIASDKFGIPSSLMCLF